MRTMISLKDQLTAFFMLRYRVIMITTNRKQLLRHFLRRAKDKFVHDDGKTHILHEDDIERLVERIETIHNIDYCKVVFTKIFKTHYTSKCIEYIIYGTDGSTLAGLYPIKILGIK